MHLGQAFQLTPGLLFHFFGHPGFFDLLLKFLDLFLSFVSLSQFFLDSLELFPEEVFFLEASHLFLGLGLDLLLDGEEFYLPVKDLGHFFEALHGI